MWNVHNTEMAESISKIFKKIKTPLSGREILEYFGLHNEDNDAILYFLLENNAFSTVKTSKDIKEYTFKVNSDKINASLIETLLQKVTQTTPPGDFEFAASFPKTLEVSKKWGIDDLYPRLCKLILGASRRIIIVNPFFDKSSIDKLIPFLKSAAKRHVKIILIVRAQNDYQINLRKIFLAIGDSVEIKYISGIGEKSPFYLHAKVMIIDDNVAYVGSANLTKYSLGENIEVGVIVSGKRVSGLSEFFNAILDKYGTDR